MWNHLKTHTGEKSDKCNQCDFASSKAGNLRTHLKTHSGEKSNKCSERDFASSLACNNEETLENTLEKSQTKVAHRKCDQTETIYFVSVNENFFLQMRMGHERNYLAVLFF